MQKNKFHLAIPCDDVNEAMSFYSSIGCKIGRFDEKMCIVDFFGAQVVCHLSADKNKQKGLYPRHFGLILSSDNWLYVEDLCNKAGVTFVKKSFIRNESKPQCHKTFFISDPSGNMIEFKYYKDSNFI